MALNLPFFYFLLSSSLIEIMDIRQDPKVLLIYPDIFNSIEHLMAELILDQILRHFLGMVQMSCLMHELSEGLKDILFFDITG